MAVQPPRNRNREGWIAAPARAVLQWPMRMNRMKVGLFLRYLAVALIPLVVLLVMGTVSVIINQRRIERQILESNRRTLEQMRGSVDAIFEELDSLDVIFSTSSEFLIAASRILGTRELDFEQSKILTVIQNFVNVSAFARPYVESIYVYIENEGHRFLTTTEGIVALDAYTDRGWFDTFRAQPAAAAFWTETRGVKRLPSDAEGRPVITLYRRIMPLIGVRVPGVVVLNIHRGYLSAFLDRLKGSTGQRIVILDSQGKAVFSDFGGSDPPWDSQDAEKDGLLAVRAEGNRYFASRMESGKYGWTYYSLTPRDRFTAESRALRNVNLAVLCLSVLLAASITLAVSRRSFRTIEGVLDVVEATERGGPLPVMPARTDKGFGHVAYSVLRTFLEHKYLQVQLSERKYRQKTLELLALQAQMNPHFLFNTLESINWKVIELTGKPNPINDMIRSLSNILKYALESPATLETLGSEIKHARDYMKIQRSRYKNKFTVRWDCARELSRRRVIRFLLQPLLENAIYHGVKEKEGRSRITVSVRGASGRMLISVADDGLGMEPERLGEVRRELEVEEGDLEAVTGHIGLQNTNRRIRLAFGLEYGLRVESARGRGTTVTAEIPLRP